jgi:exonuclease III
MIKYKAEPRDIVVIQVYFPTTEAEENEIEEMYARLEELCKLAKRSDNLIIIGHWNAVIGEGADRQVVGADGLGTRNEKGERLVDFYKQYDLVITNTYQNIHRRKRYT